MESSRASPCFALQAGLGAEEVSDAFGSTGRMGILQSIAAHAPIEQTLDRIVEHMERSFHDMTTVMVTIDPDGQCMIVGSAKLPPQLSAEMLASCTAEFLRLDVTNKAPEIVELCVRLSDSRRIRYWPLTGVDGRPLGAIAHYRNWRETTPPALITALGSAAYFSQIALEQDLAAHQINRLLLDERQTIAERLHDDAIQSITAASLMLQRVAIDSEPEQARNIEKVRRRIDTAGQTMRRVLFELHPLLVEEAGLTAAVEAYLEGTFDVVDTTWAVDDEMTAEPDRATSLLAFRLIHEALANVAKHSEASHVKVRLSTPASLEIDVVDDGVGFDNVTQSSEVGHFGRANVESLARRAAGSIVHVSTLGNGCTVQIRLPLVKAHLVNVLGEV